MSTDWACHYQRNLPGYKNPYQLCATELQNMLVCSQPLITQPINVGFSGWYIGLATANRPTNFYYSNCTGYFTVNATTGTSNTPLSGATVTVTLMKYRAGVSAQSTLLSTGLTTDKSGNASGLFLFAPGTGNDLYSGIAVVLSGNLTGAAYIESSYFTAQPQAIGSWSTNASTHQASMTITNTDPYAPGTINILKSINGISSYSVVNSHYYQPGDFLSQTFTINAGEFHYYKTQFTPTGGTKPTESAVESGGYPPIPNALSLMWLFVNTTDTRPTAFLRIDIDSGNVDRYDPNGYGIQGMYQPVAGGAWSALPTTVQYQSGYFLCNIDSLVLGQYNFKVSGAFPDSAASYFYSPVLGPTVIDLGSISASAKTSTSGCGIDVFWNASMSNSYEIHISTTSSMTSYTVATPPDSSVNMYRYDTLGTCGTPYFFQVCVAGGGGCSNVVSGSGVYKLSTPNVYPTLKYVDPTNVIPTTQFLVHLDWSHNQDPMAMYISGTRNNLVDPIVNELFYAINLGNSDDSSPCTLYQGQRNPVQYNLAFVSGAITGLMSVTAVLAPRQPITPSNLVATPDGHGNVGLTWNGDVTDFYDSYQVVRSGTTTMATFITKNASYTDTPGAGTWNYYVLGISINESYNNFTGYSSLSNRQTVTI